MKNLIRIDDFMNNSFHVFLKNPSCNYHFMNKLRRMNEFINELSRNDDFMNKISRMDDFINITKLPRLFHEKTLSHR